jgi:transposase InsO family protein
VAVDWAIVNKTAVPGEPNVFAVFEDTNIGIVHVVCTTSRGLAGEALLHYIQQWGTPKTIHHDNAEEFLKGKFAEICREKGIRQTQSAPYTPNQNPTEKYMDILVSGARSLLYTSGLQPEKF